MYITLLVEGVFSSIYSEDQSGSSILYFFVSFCISLGVGPYTCMITSFDRIGFLIMKVRKM